jgi:DNA primase
LRVSAAALPAGEDPDSFLAAGGGDALREIVDRAPDALEAVMSRIVSQGCSTPAEKSDAVGRVAPLLALVADSVERIEYTRRLAAWTGTDPEAVQRVVRSAAKGRSAPELKLPRTSLRRRDSREERHLLELAVLYYKHPALHGCYERERISELLPNCAWKQLVIQLLDAAQKGWVNEDGTIDLSRIEKELDQEAGIRLREIALDDVLFKGEFSAEQELDGLVRSFDKRRRVALQRELTRRLAAPDADGEALMREKDELRGNSVAPHGLQSSRAP